MGNIVNFLGNLVNLSYIDGSSKYYISDANALYAQAAIFSPLATCMFTMPLQVHFVRICPNKIAGTALAILVGINNFSQSIIPQLSANEVNRWFIGLSHKHLTIGNLEGN